MLHSFDDIDWMPDTFSIIIPYSLYLSDWKDLLVKNDIKYSPLIKPDSRNNNALQIDFPNIIEKNKAIAVLSTLPGPSNPQGA